MTTPDSPQRQALIQGFITELGGFAQKAEAVLGKIEATEDTASTTQDFKVFTYQMIAIRGTADQLGFPQISKLAGLGEEISVKAEAAQTRNQIRKSVSALWDALTTIKYMVQNPEKETGEEEQILTTRLESVLKFLGGRRETVSADDIEALLRNAGKR